MVVQFSSITVIHSRCTRTSDNPTEMGTESIQARECQLSSYSKEYNEHVVAVDVFIILMSMYKVDQMVQKYIILGTECWHHQWMVALLSAAAAIHSYSADLVELAAAISEALIYQKKLCPVAVRRSSG